MKRFQLPLSELCEWSKLGLALSGVAGGESPRCTLSQVYLTAMPWRMLAGLAVFAVVYMAAARVILREEYGYVMRASAEEDRMTARPTLLIVSYHYAPSPMVGAKRFSFLTREFARQGFDVHVVTQRNRRVATRPRRPFAAGGGHRASRRQSAAAAAER